MDGRICVSITLFFIICSVLVRRLCFRERFGIYQVDFEDDDRPRTEKASAQFYREVIKKRCVVGKEGCV